jgi:hypothetical protein
MLYQRASGLRTPCCPAILESPDAFPSYWIVMKLWILLFGASSAFAVPFDASSQFSLSTNVAGNTWSYWGATSATVSTYASNSSLLPTFFSNCEFAGSPPLPCWDAAGASFIAQNATGSDHTSNSTAIARAGQLTFDPQGIALVRFLVAVPGSYAVSGFFEGSSTASPSQTSTEFITVNGNVVTPLFNKTGALGLGAVNTFNFSIALNGGDRVDFLVAGVPSGDIGSLATGFAATITPQSGVPEPGTFVLIVTGLAVLVAWVRRRHYSRSRA